MKIFEEMEVEEAIGFSISGGQALHLHQIIVNRSTAPKCFIRDVDAGRDIAHLFDLDTERLKKTCRKLGVKVIFIDREGTDRQHIDLCGMPLERAKALAQALAEKPKEFF